jgi:hypothetical protein
MSATRDLGNSFSANKIQKGDITMPGIQANSASKKMLWTGRTLTTLVVLFLLMDAAMHLSKIPPVVAAFAQLGLPLQLAFTLAMIKLVCLALYLYPRTSVLGAVLLTGYLGGAVAIHLRVGNPLFGETLFPVYMGVLLWGGLYLRDTSLRALFPFRTSAVAKVAVG